MTPENKDLTAIGWTVHDVVNRLQEYVKHPEAPRWVVKWRGRIRAMDGSVTFPSRAGAEKATKMWLRETLRYAMNRVTAYANNGTEATPVKMLPGNWGYRKSYRDYVDSLFEYLVTEGYFEFVEIEPALRPPDQVVANG